MEKLLPAAPRHSPTTKDISLLSQLFKENQLQLAPEFQRNSVWPAAAKAYLIDTILNGKPIPLLFFQRTTSPNTGRSVFLVIDGQQRLRAIFDFLEDRFRLTESQDPRFRGKKFSELASEFQQIIYNYDLVVAELSGYADADIKDMFVRINKYVVKLSPQELRHAQGEGKFNDFVEAIGRWPFWKENRVFTDHQVRRMKSVEFAAELVILVVEGPQDKKSSLELYYGEYKKKLPFGPSVEAKLRVYLDWILTVLPDLPQRRYRKSVDLYSLIGAIERASDGSMRLSKLNKDGIRERLVKFEAQTLAEKPVGSASRYLVASTSQTDNITPRTTRIEILEELLKAG